MPFFSIITPTYNRATFLKETIDTILQQTFEDYELIVVDDGSTDDTEQIAATLTSDKVKYYKKQNGERGAARNYGAAKATGKYLIFFDSDDVMYPDHLSVLFDFIRKNEQPEVVYNPYEILNKTTGNKTTLWETPDNLKQKLAIDNFLACNSVTIRNDIFQEVKFTEDRRLATAEDKELWLRVAAMRPFRFNPHIGFAMIEHENRSLNTIKPERIEERTLLFIENLKKDKLFLHSFGPLAGFIFGFEYVLVALYFAATNKKKARHYLWLSVKESRDVLKTKRFWATFKNTLFRRS